MSKVELQRLEKESERFTSEIKQKETENVKLIEEIDTIKVKIAESRKTLDEISQVSFLFLHYIFITYNLSITYKPVDITSFQGRQSDNNQQLKMKQIMSQSQLSHKNDIRAKEILELRSQLKKLRMKTFPSFGTTT